MKKANHEWLAFLIESNGRGEKIRTSDPLHPMQVRYQAALRPDELRIISERPGFLAEDFSPRVASIKLLSHPLRQHIQHRTFPLVQNFTRPRIPVLFSTQLQSNN